MLDKITDPGTYPLLVTGASGFLGTRLTERLQSRGFPVRALARNEGKLIELKQKFPSIEIFTGSISDTRVCEQACRGVRGVFHLAGFKHVGLAEVQPLQCTETNVTGSINILQASTCADFVIATSTDKAARVAGVYGASKLLMEQLFWQWQNIGRTEYRIVRYGNVLYSTGSVLCKWRAAIEAGNPLVITDPDATRFYWTVNQAVDLLFECLANVKDAKPYVPVMKAIRMGDLLKAVIEKYAPSYGTYPYEEIGLQPGENKHETMGGTTNSKFTERYTAEEIKALI